MITTALPGFAGSQACAGVNRDVFLPRPASSDAKAICSHCPFLTRCHNPHPRRPRRLGRPHRRRAPRTPPCLPPARTDIGERSARRAGARLARNIYDDPRR